MYATTVRVYVCMWAYQPCKPSLLWCMHENRFKFDVGMALWRGGAFPCPCILESSNIKSTHPKCFQIWLERLDGRLKRIHVQHVHHVQHVQHVYIPGMTNDLALHLYTNMSRYWGHLILLRSCECLATSLVVMAMVWRAQMVVDQLGTPITTNASVQDSPSLEHLKLPSSGHSSTAIPN